MSEIETLLNLLIHNPLFLFPSIRSRMALTATQAFYLLVNNKSLATMSLTMAEVYRDYKDEDGFVYMTYASQENNSGNLSSVLLK
uniref:Microtubule-associated proteins 1A/1B light chain 3C n=1 Tax=Amazona collaria TaxID=241587 RepID=A0A8B9IV70_9PSIT